MSECTCKSQPGAPVYVLGQIRIGLSTPGVEHAVLEAAYTTAMAPSGTSSLGQSGVPTIPAKYLAIALRAYPHLARAVRYVLFVERVPVWELRPRTDSERSDLLIALESESGVEPNVAIAGVARGAAGYNNLPVLEVEAAWHFDASDPARDSTGVSKDSTEGASDAERTEDVRGRVYQLAANRGTEPEHRAINYVVAKAGHLYRLAREGKEPLTIETRPSRLASAGQVLIDVIVGNGGAHRWFIRVDVTEMYPWTLTPTFERYLER